MADTDLRAELARLQAENQALKEQAAPQGVTFKVAPKGGASVYGLGSRFPTTLYAEQWTLLLEHAEELREFLRANAASLKPKP